MKTARELQLETQPKAQPYVEPKLQIVQHSLRNRKKYTMWKVGGGVLCEEKVLYNMHGSLVQSSVKLLGFWFMEPLGSWGAACDSSLPTSTSSSLTPPFACYSVSYCNSLYPSGGI